MKIKQIVKPSLAVLAAGILSACATIKQRQSRRHDRQSGFPGTLFRNARQQARHIPDL
ncbi:hypothetical protein M717_06800 [Neisseria gonorrhoeae SK33414]|uniref:Lipoprotein n=2 Tax=Neisseria gonorrhoeae TaxID=485 RepID=A0AA44UAC4_NEIGO|nr:lipoprotein [Neisseria gonorrhoeae NCCP11945]KLR76943.1 hypothetical protein M717_06800 [Neisseria gonorrhoeae SK33414]KLR79010.1 hypothetical protein M680_02065 [Neisseria gonorrhoeae SK8976]KLR80879.1 hypothetical protein M679_09355 [Neisseria gonorrhoeae SK7842]KLR85947.1 hypothetical protein M675_09090 [Neisseria gonorrhoeae SK1902]KLR87994.1 hypothetical protein M702_03925 [Neisseria gonorrhoeae SK28355]KLR89053.1 hypothetical protein M677_10075 [Neisseria gonorrhoeae SK6987]KLR98616